MRRKAIKAEELGKHNASSNLCQDEGMLRKRLGKRWSVTSSPPYFLIQSQMVLLIFTRLQLQSGKTDGHKGGEIMQ